MAFSMIELLVVIAIIALLAAIIFPVFATVRENARQSNSMSNLHDISTKMEQYRLDTQHYPPVLFGYYPTESTSTGMDKVLDYCQAKPQTDADACQNLLPGLYPEYVKSWTEFEDPNNNVPATTSVSTAQTYLCSGPSDTTDGNCASTTGPGTLVMKSGTDLHSFYAADAYDVSPELNTAGNDVTGTLITRYQTSWTGIDASLDCGFNQASPPANAVSYGFCTDPVNTSQKANLYVNQLRWRNPPSNTYVTSTTYHVKQAGIVLVLTQDGTVIKMDAKKFAAFEGPINIDTSKSPQGVDTANFWKCTL